MKKETAKVWHPLKLALDSLGWDYQRLEDRYTPGIPDLNIHVPNVGDVWIELKVYEEMKLSPEQCVWLIKGQRAGRRVYVVARSKEGWYLWESHFKNLKESEPYVFNNPIELLRHIVNA